MLVELDAVVNCVCLWCVCGASGVCVGQVACVWGKWCVWGASGVCGGQVACVGGKWCLRGESGVCGWSKLSVTCLLLH